MTISERLQKLAQDAESIRADVERLVQGFGLSGGNSPRSRGIPAAAVQPANRNKWDSEPPKCTRDGCDAPARCKSLCQKHYKQNLALLKSQPKEEETP